MKENRLGNNMKRQKNYKLLSLFSGCGGMDLGFDGDFMVHEKSVNPKYHVDFVQRKDTGRMVWLRPTSFEIVFANDITRYGKNAWVHNFKKRGYDEKIYHLESIVDLVKWHKQGKNIFPNDVDIVTGGFPCQDFSVSGSRMGFKSGKDHTGKSVNVSTASTESRGKLYMWMKEVIDIVQPKIFIAENVKGLVNLDNVKDIIQQDFSRAHGNGYVVLPPKVLQAAFYGVPQSRERVFFIGIKKNELKKGILEKLMKDPVPEEFDPYPSPSHAVGNSKDYSSAVKIKDIFKSLEEPGETRDLSQKYFSKAKYMGKHCQGQTEINLDGVGPTIRSEHHGNIEYRRLSSKNGGKITSELEKGLAERRLTPRECGLIQTFPPDYEFVIPNGNKRFLVSTSSAYKLIGNAVPPLLAYHLAKRIEKLWNEYFK